MRCHVLCASCIPLIALSLAFFVMSADTADARTVARCPHITRTLLPGSAGADVSDLQAFLKAENVFTADVTGYFGSETTLGVQKWQTANGVISSGTPLSTGWGSVGPLTRDKMATRCSDISGFTVPGTVSLTVGQRSSTADRRLSVSLSKIALSQASAQRARPVSADIAITQNPCGTNTTCKAALMLSSKTIAAGRPVSVGAYTFSLSFLSGTNIVISVTGPAATSTPSSSHCLALTHNFGIDDTDAGTGGDVTRLQRFLAADPSIYPEAAITGYFGSATMRAVQRWQARAGLVSSGDPESTGYGYVGPRTRVAMNASCEDSVTPTPPSGAPRISVHSVPGVSRGSTLTISWESDNAPSGSAVALFLAPSGNTSGTSGLIAGRLATSDTYHWTVPGGQTGNPFLDILAIAECPADAATICGATLSPGTYTVTARLYTPADACLGTLCNDPPEILATARLPVTIFAGPVVPDTSTPPDTDAPPDTTPPAGPTCAAANSTYADGARVDGQIIVGGPYSAAAATVGYTCSGGYWVCTGNCGTNAGVSYTYQDGQLVPRQSTAKPTPGYTQPPQSCSGNFKWCALGQSYACLPAYMCS